jgi:hypothetical protein
MPASTVSPEARWKQRHLKCRSYDKKEDMIST